MASGCKVPDLILRRKRREGMGGEGSGKREGAKRKGREEGGEEG